MSNELLKLAWHYHSVDDYPRAEQLCRQSLQADNRNQEAWRLQGEVCLFQGKAAEATQGLQQALRLGPLPAEGHNNLGVALARQDRLEEAVSHYLQAVQMKPTYVECYNNLGVALTDLARPTEAVTYLRRALDLNPNYPLAHNSLGIALAALGQLDEAQASYHQALRLRPNYANAYNNLGIALAAQGRLDEAVASYHQALQLQADNVSALNALGAALAAQGKLDEAVASYEHAQRSDPEYAETYNNVAVARMQQGELDEALASYTEALQRKPEYADAHKNLSMALLLKGDFERGWREYEWRWRCKDFSPPPYSQPIWDGSPLRGQTILLHAEQGLGDTLQFIRYASRVKQQGGIVVAACQKALLPVLSNCPGVDALVNRDGPLPPFDVYSPLLSLPRILGTTIESMPAEVPYLVANPKLVDHWRERLREFPGFKIGINWHGRPGHGIWRHRNIPLSHFAELAQIPGVQLISLQKGAGREELSAARDQFPIVDLGDNVDEAQGAFTDTAAIMMNLDLVITSDTAVPHLAGALGVPVWVALPFAACWRWLLHREDSPWYPTMRLFRQSEFKNWPPVFASLLSAVKQQMAASSSSARPMRVEIATAALRAEIPTLRVKGELAVENETLALAWHYHASDDYGRVEQVCRQILQADVRNQEAWRLLSEACLFQGKFAEATEGYLQALRLGPIPAEACNNLGVALARQGKQEEAVGHYLQAVQLRPTYVEAYNNLGVALTELNQIEQAAVYLRRALDLNPDYAPAHNSLGIALAAQGEFAEAVASYHQAIQLRPNYANAYGNLGLALASQGKLDEAVWAHRQALRWNPKSSEVHNNLGAALVAQGQLDEAVECYRWVAQANPDSLQANHRLADALLQQGGLDEAVSLYEQARQAHPECAETHSNVAVARLQQGRVEQAIAGYRQALQRKPEYADAHRNIGIALLLTGDFEQGWREYEWRWRCKDFVWPPYPQPLWDGSPLEGRTILLHAEQGLGDTLQFIRYAALVEQCGGTVVVACQKVLLPLLAGCSGLAALVDRDGPLPPFDVHAPLISLPHIFGTTLATVPAEIPYLHVPKKLVEHWRDQLHPRGPCRIGVAWQGSPTHRLDRFRSFPLACLEPLTRLPQVRLISLQKGPGTEQLDALGGRFPLVDMGRHLDEVSGPFVDTAAVIKSLDLVITCDTAIAHLAGALGAPVWVALADAPDWRWLLHREDSPWYPTMRLFRQRRLGDWADVVTRMASALEHRL